MSFDFWVWVLHLWLRLAALVWRFEKSICMGSENGAYHVWAIAYIAERAFRER